MKKRQFFLLISIVLFVTIILSVFLVITNYKTEEEKTELYENLLEDVVETANLTISDKLNDVSIAFNAFSDYDNSTKDKLVSNIKKLDKMFLGDNVEILLMNKEGEAFNSDGYFRFEVDFEEENRIFFYEKNNIEYIAFVYVIEQDFIVEGCTLNYFVHSIPFSTIRPYFEPAGIKQSCYVAIVEEDGDILFHINGKIHSNFYDFLRNYEVGDENEINKIVNNMASKKVDCNKIKIDNEKNYLLYQELNGWNLVIISPTDFLYKESFNYTGLTTLFFILLVIVVLISTVMLANSLGQSIKNQKLNTHLKEIAEEANKANVAKSQFLSRISHDIRTPMNGIIGMTYIAKNNINDKVKLVEYLNKIGQASDHLLTLLNNVLDLSRIESGIVELKNSPTNLKELLESCEAMLISQSQAMLLKLKTKFNLIHNYIVIDEVRLKQILINLLSNAVKFNNRGGQISFLVTENQIDSDISQYTFEIIDNGKGMSKEFIDKIYEPFVQEDLEDARTKYKGSGLGMAIVKELVDLMDGEIIIDSKVGFGTVIKVIIKCEFLKDEKEINAKMIEYERLAGMKILLVEDNEINMEIAETLLSEVGINITKAFNGKEAVDIYLDKEESYFDLVLMDVLMPVMGGYEATKIIRQSNRKDSLTLPILAMTANAYNEDKEKALKSGMNSHIAKPIQIEKLFDYLLKYKK